MMHVQSLNIHNFRQIEELGLVFEPGVNIIYGENGKGKTSILEALAVALGGFMVSLPDVRARSFSLPEVRTVYQREGDGAYVPYQMWPSVECTVQIGGKSYSWLRNRSGRQARTSVRPRDICHVAEGMLNDPSAVLPVICYQSAARIWAQKREKVQDIFRRKVYARTVGYVDCLEDESSIKMMLNWCVKMEQIAWQKGQAVAEYEAVKRMVGQAVAVLTGCDARVFYDRQTEELMCQQGELVEPVSLMSSGYQSFVWLVFDVAYRMAVLNPQLRDKVSETPGVVLIDEIDMHLHPRWQWRVVDAIRQVFPNVQFIVTTHAPIVLASAKDVHCIDLSGFPQVKYAGSGYGLRVDDVLAVMQGTLAMPAGVKKLLKQFYQQVDAQQWERANASLQMLGREMGTDKPLFVRANADLELERALAEDM